MRASKLKSIIGQMKRIAGDGPAAPAHLSFWAGLLQKEAERLAFLERILAITRGVKHRNATLHSTIIEFDEWESNQIEGGL